MEQYLSNILRKLAEWVGIPYDGEFRNGHAAHIFAGWALCLTLDIIVRVWADYAVLGVFLKSLPIWYGVYRELEDAKFKISNWNRKSWADLLTWEIGCIIGLTIGESIWLSYWVF